MASLEWKTDPEDRRILRELARRQLDNAHSPLNESRRERWLRHNSLQGGGPMILAETGGVAQAKEWDLTPQLQCKEDWARGVEHRLRHNLYQFEEIRDDAVVTPFYNVSWSVSVSDYGVPVPRVEGGREGKMGSYHWDPPIKDLERDFEKLRPRTFSVDRERSLTWKSHMESVFDGILPVRLRCGYWWTVGLTITAIDLIGIENLMLFMYDAPQGLHRLMAFLRDDMLSFMEWTEREGLLTLNNESDYVGSGSQGHSNELPHPGLRPGDPARLEDLWGLCESQETVGVGPALFEEFIFPYQQVVAERFGLTYYGCCEPVHSRWHVVRRLRNLRKISVSPWCNEEKMAEALGSDYVFCRKPNPTLVSTPHFDEDAIRDDIRRTLLAASRCNVEFAMKDVHTVCGDMGRLRRWVEIAREECGV